MQKQQPGVQTAKLSKRHKEELKVGSGISKAVREARGYRTITDKDDLLKEGYDGKQLLVPGLLVPVRDVSGRVPTVQYKPDDPRTNDDGETVKYENLPGARVVLDVPVASAAALADPGVPLWVTEGPKKADAAVTAGLCCIGVLGVWAWKRDGAPLPDWDEIALAGREVFLAYDSDVMRKTEVQSALDGLTAFLRERGALVRWVLLPEGGSLAGETVKVGLDDWLVANGMDPSGLAEFVREPEVNIKVNDVPLPVITRQAIAALRESNDPKRLFTRDDLLVEARASGLTEVVKDRLTFLLGEAGNWYVTTKEGRKPKPPPPHVVANVLAAGQELWNFDLLDRIVTTPVFAEDGTLRTEPGYHESSRSYYLPPEGLEIPSVSAEPTAKEVKKAKARIDDLLSDFPFVDAADRAHAWALVLQPFARELIWGSTPLFSVQAPKQGTGKTLLVQSALAPSAGDVDSLAEPHGDDEMEKRLTARLREAAPVVFFDNVDRVMAYPSLASALTKPTWSGRVLGKSATVTMPINCTFVFTANNPRFSDDLRRRVVPIRLDTGIEDPSKRKGFRHSLPGWALKNRGDLVWAACTLISSWVAAGRPRPESDTATLGSYGPWRRVLGGLLQHIGVPGFLGNLESKALDKSPEAEAFELIAHHAVEHYGEGEAWFAGDLATHLHMVDVELSLGRRYRDSDELAGLLGTFLAQRKGQIVAGYRLERATKRRSRGYPWRFTSSGEAA